MEYYYYRPYNTTFHCTKSNSSSFADNIVVMMQGPSLPAIFKTLQTALKTIED